MLVITFLFFSLSVSQPDRSHAFVERLVEYFTRTRSSARTVDAIEQQRDSGIECFLTACDDARPVSGTRFDQPKLRIPT